MLDLLGSHRPRDPFYGGGKQYKLMSDLIAICILPDKSSDKLTDT